MGQLDVARYGRVDGVVAAAEGIGVGVTVQNKDAHETNDRHVALFESVGLPL